jgi:hypothetical protein
MREGSKRLLEVVHGLAVGRPRQGLLPGLPQVHHGFVPHLAAPGMVGETFDLLGQTVGIALFEGLDNARMQHPPPLQQEAAIGHLVCQGMLEGVLRLGKQAGLIEELGRLQARQAPV